MPGRGAAFVPSGAPRRGRIEEASSVVTGAQAICDALADAGIEHVFGLPGTQNVPLFEALRTSRLRVVVATSELSAAMMANGYFRSSGRLAALVTIPGPGFAWAFTGLAEASLDSAALVHVVGTPATAPGERFQLQAIDQATIAAPLVRAVHAIGCADDAGAAVRAACADAVSGEPGPVLVHVDRRALGEAKASARRSEEVGRTVPVDADTLDAALRAVASARRCVIFAGQGCSDESTRLRQVAEALGAPVATTASGRGVVPEDHPLSLGFAFAGNGAAVLNELIEASDLVLAIGCKFSHNGSRGFRLRIPPDKLVHVDASAAVLGANYPARVALRADAGDFLVALERTLAASERPAGFGADELARLRERGRAESLRELVEPRVHGVPGATPAAFFAALREAMPRRSVLVTDSGLHQVLARHHFPVFCARGLMTPTNLQSMGFAIGAAVGACLAEAERPVVALVGDGGLAMSGLELLAAVRERVRLVVVVFVDAAYGLIRLQQYAASGRAFATDLPPFGIEALAQAVGARHVRLDGDAAAVLRDAIASDGVTIVEVALGDALPMRWLRAKAIAKTTAGPRARSWLRRVLRRR